MPKETTNLTHMIRMQRVLEECALFQDDIDATKAVVMNPDNPRVWRVINAIAKCLDSRFERDKVYAQVLIALVVTP